MAKPCPIIKSLSQLIVSQKIIWLHFSVTTSVLPCVPMTTIPLQSSNLGQNHNARVFPETGEVSPWETLPALSLLRCPVREIHVVTRGFSLGRWKLSERRPGKRSSLGQTTDVTWKFKFWELVPLTPAMLRIIWKIFTFPGEDLRQKLWLKNVWLCRTGDSICQRGTREGGLVLKAEQTWSCVNHSISGPVFALPSAWQARLPAFPRTCSVNQFKCPSSDRPTRLLLHFEKRPLTPDPSITSSCWSGL